MKKFFIFIKESKKIIDDIDKNFHYELKNKDYSANPFFTNKNKTFIWIEKVKDKK